MVVPRLPVLQVDTVRSCKGIFWQMNQGTLHILVLKSCPSPVNYYYTPVRFKSRTNKSHFLGHIFRSIKLMVKVNTDPIYSGVEDENEFYLYPSYSGDQLQKLLAKAFYYSIFNRGDFVW